MSNEELAKVAAALLDKYEVDEASLLIVKLVQALNPPQPYVPFRDMPNPITSPSITWNGTESPYDVRFKSE